MDQKEFCLKWNSYSDVFQGTFATLLRNERFTDLTLSCEGQTIKCHKVVLSACSSYFENLLLDTAHPHPIIILRDVRFRDMQALVKFMYTGEVTVAQAQINSLIKVADLLKIKGLADPDESPDPVEQEPEPLPEKKTVTPPPAKRKRVEPRIEPEAENNFLQDPLQDLVPSNKRMSSVPVASVLEASSSSAVQVQPEEASDSPLPLNFKEEVADFSLEADDSSSQYEDQGDDFDYGNDNLVPGETNDKGEAGPSSGVNPAGLLELQAPVAKRGKREKDQVQKSDKKIALALAPGFWTTGTKISLTTKVATVGSFGDTFHCSLTALSVTPTAVLTKSADIPSLLNDKKRYYSTLGFLQFLKEELAIYDIECYASMIFKVMCKEIAGNCIKAKNPFVNNADDRFLISTDLLKFLSHVVKANQVMTISDKSKSILQKVLSALLNSNILHKSGNFVINIGV